MAVLAHDWKQVIGFEKELSWGSIAPGANIDWQRFYEDDDIFMGAEVVELTGTEETRNDVEYARGNYVFEGNTVTNLECVPDKMNVMLEALFGSISGSNPYSFTPGDDLPSMTVWKRVGEIYSAIVGCKVNALEFAFNVGTMKATMELRPRHVEYMDVGSFPARVHSNKRPFMFWGVVLNWGGSSTPIKEGTLRFDNQLPTDDFYSGSPYTAEHAEGVRQVTGSMTLRFETRALAEEFINIELEKSLSITITSPHGDTLVWTIPRIVKQAGWRVRKSENLFRVEMPWKAYADAAGNICTAVLTTV
jgi:hypothetical protein